MYSKAQLKQIIVEEFKQVHMQLSESVSNWSSVEKYLQNTDADVLYVDDAKTYKLTDPKLGIVYIMDDGTAYIKNSKKETSWSFTGTGATAALSIDGTRLTIDTASKDSAKDSNKSSQNKYKAIRQMHDKDSEMSGIDVFQTVLDWLGFIPGYGDIIDAVNAIIYFARGKWIDGALSLVAIIPVVGTGIKLGLKGSIEALGGLYKAERIWAKAATGSVNDLANFYQEAARLGKLNSIQLRTMARKGDELAKLLKRGSAYVRKNESAIKVFGVNGKAVAKQMDDVSTTVRNLTVTPIERSFAGKVIDKISSVGKKGADGVINYTKAMGRGGLALFTAGGSEVAINLLKKLGVSKREMELLKQTMDTRFIKKLEKSPLTLAGILKSTPGMNASELSRLGIPANVWRRKTKGMTEWLEQLKKTDTLRYKQVSNSIAKRAANAENPYYVAFVGDAFQQASNIFRPGAVFKTDASNMFARIFKLDSYRLSNPKNLDIVSNEIQDLGEKLGIDTENNPQGVIMPAIFYVFNKYIVDTYKKGQDIAPQLATMGVAGTVLATAGDILSTDDEVPGGEVVQTNEPEAELATIKNDFLNAPGTTSEKLAKLQELGWSDDEIETLKKQLDID
jgi:hypothetical protein